MTVSKRVEELPIVPGMRRAWAVWSVNASSAIAAVNNKKKVPASELVAKATGLTTMNLKRYAVRQKASK